MSFHCKFAVSVDIRSDVTAAQVAQALAPLAEALGWPSSAVITGYLLGNPADIAHVAQW